jgi:3-deoxy-7-phosphoheptulonate synthase
MIVVLKPDADQKQIDWITKKLADKGLELHSISGQERTVLAVVGTTLPDPREIQLMPGVARVVKISKPYKLASREASGETSKISLRANGPVVGGPQVVVMAGPCSIEGREKFLEIAEMVKRAGAGVIRGGAFKPRTSPYSFQGMGEEGLKILQEAGEKFDLATVTEVMSPAQVELVNRYADVLQVGTRNMQNFELLKEVGMQDKPVLLKRGLAATIEELLMSAEYILSGPGNAQVILCERGIRTFESSTRNTLDLSAIPVLRKLTHLPILVDPSHGTGVRTYVSSMAMAAVAAGADALMIECHQNPEEAFSDGAQSLYPEQLNKLMKDLAVIAPVVGKQMEGLHRRQSPPSETPTGETEKVGLQGLSGSFSEKAIHQYFGTDTPTQSYETFEQLFAAVNSGEVMYAMVPVENSLTGSIHVNYDLLLEHEELTIVGELKVRIQHNLVANTGVEIRDIETVFSHPQAAAQCDRFLSSNLSWKVVNMYDTAGSAEHILKNSLVRSAAISSLAAAERLGLTVLEEGIESNPRNFTRFLVVTQKDSAKTLTGTPDKASLVFDTADSPGALYHALECFSQNSINLKKLESRPIAGKPWEYMFYLDVEIPEPSSVLDEALTKLAEQAPYFRELGRYKSAP